MENFSEDRIIKDRLDKLNRLNELNIDPYPNRWIANREKISDVISSFIDNETKTMSDSEKILSVSGRILAIRGMGKVIFFDLKDQSGKIQLHFKEDESEISKDFVDLLDIGDIIGVEGIVFRTRRGEITLRIKNIVLLTFLFLVD